MTFVMAKYSTPRAEKQYKKRKKITTTTTPTTQQQQQQQQKTEQSVTKIPENSRATTAANVRNSKRFGTLLLAKQTTVRSNRIFHPIRVW